MSHWKIRSATDEDIASVLRLWVQAEAPPTVGDTHAGLSQLLEADREALLIAESDGLTVGSVIAAWDGWRGCFYRLAVHPDARRQGVATSILREGERRLRARGAARLTAVARNEDAVAMGFWKAAGYHWQRDRARFVRLADE